MSVKSGVSTCLHTADLVVTSAFSFTIFFYSKVFESISRTVVILVISRTFGVVV
jgi:hypothetical protein